MKKEPASPVRPKEQDSRSAAARSAWSDYQSERVAVVNRTEQLRAQRLAAEAKASVEKFVTDTGKPE